MQVVLGRVKPCDGLQAQIHVKKKKKQEKKMLPYKPLRLGWQRFGAKKLQQMESVANWPAAEEEEEGGEAGAAWGENSM